jgi:tetratricopeptide (TPR) repeat protein
MVNYGSGFGLPITALIGSSYQFRRDAACGPAFAHNKADCGATGRRDVNPKDFNAFNSRGKAYEVPGRRAEAIADFRKAQSIDPADPLSKQQLRVLGF